MNRTLIGLSSILDYHTLPSNAPWSLWCDLPHWSLDAPCTQEATFVELLQTAASDQRAVHLIADRLPRDEDLPGILPILQRSLQIGPVAGIWVQNAGLAAYLHRHIPGIPCYWTYRTGGEHHRSFDHLCADTQFRGALVGPQTSARSLRKSLQWLDIQRTDREFQLFVKIGGHQPIFQSARPLAAALNILPEQATSWLRESSRPDQEYPFWTTSWGDSLIADCRILDPLEVVADLPLEHQHLGLILDARRTADARALWDRWQRAQSPGHQPVPEQQAQRPAHPESPTPQEPLAQVIAIERPERALVRICTAVNIQTLQHSPLAWHAPDGTQRRASLRGLQTWNGAMPEPVLVPDDILRLEWQSGLVVGARLYWADFPPEDSR